MARARPVSPTHPTDRLLGNCPAISALRAQIRHLAPFDAMGHPSVPTVLLYGETGTGKGLVARVIHDSGPRAQGPFLDVNCAAIPEALLEAELFGYEAGAFTDARRAKPGLFEAASAGTLFLDEIDALPLPLQGKVLTAIEEKRVRRVGAVAAQGLLGQAYYFLGDYRRAVDILRRNVAFLEGELLRERFGLPNPASVFSRTWLVASLAELGAFAEGIARGEEAVRIAESIDQPGRVVQASFGTGLLHLRKGDVHKAIAALERGLELCQVRNIEAWFANFTSHLGYAYALSGRVAEAVPVLEQAVGPNVLTAGMGILWMAYRSEACLLAGRRNEAIQLAERALELARQHNELGNRAYTLRLLGEIAVHRDPVDVESAEAHYR
jgi:tetratricopeptide (TPR) repeat protein